MKKLLFAIIAAAMLLSGCNKTETGTNRLTGGPGTLSVKITDAPFNIDFVESATVTITKIEIRNTNDTTGNPYLVLTEEPVTVDLFQLRNGITEELVNLVIPMGDYDLIRLYVSEASLKLKEHDEAFNLKVPSGKQTGIKVFIKPPIHVEGGISAELLLDFDLSKSFVMRGNLHHAGGVNGFIFKPVVKATNNSTAGRIEGFVTDDTPEQNKIANASVSLIKSATDTVETFTDETGHYAFIGVPAGSYDMYATAPYFDTANAQGIVVYAANKVIQDFTITGIPTYIGSVIENATPAILEMNYSMVLANIVPDTSAFTVKVSAVERTITSISISDKKVLLTLSSAVLKDEVVTVAYIKPDTDPLQSASGVQAASVAESSVTNNVGI